MQIQSGAFASRTGVKLTGRELFQFFPGVGDGRWEWVCVNSNRKSSRSVFIYNLCADVLL